MMVNQDFAKFNVVNILFFNNFLTVKNLFKDLELIIGGNDAYFVIRHEDLVPVRRVNEFTATAYIADIDSIFLPPLQVYQTFTYIIGQRLHFKFNNVYVPGSQTLFYIGSAGKRGYSFRVSHLRTVIQVGDKPSFNTAVKFVQPVGEYHHQDNRHRNRNEE